MVFEAVSIRVFGMPLITEYTTFEDAQKYCSKEKLWELFDGIRESINIAHECVDRHPREQIAVQIAIAEGSSESITFGELSDWSGRYANYIRSRGIRPSERVALMVEPSLPFYVALYGAMKAGCVAVPLFTLFGPDGLRMRVGDCHPKLLLLAPERMDWSRHIIFLISNWCAWRKNRDAAAMLSARNGGALSSPKVPHIPVFVQSW